MKKKYSNQRGVIYLLVLLIVSYLGNLYLQFMQNNMSLDLALKFALSWHTEKFLISTVVLFFGAFFLANLLGSLAAGIGVFSVATFLIGVATYLKMKYRMEPVYPDDLKMITEFSLLKDMAGWPLFILAIVLIILVVFLALWQLKKSFRLPKRRQIWRVGLLILSSLFLFYAAQFNRTGNLLKKAYDRTALWIPYSQKMNYYNVGFVGGFLFNLNVPAMDEPTDYSKETMTDLAEKYAQEATENNSAAESAQPNIIFVMSESFSDGTKLNGVDLSADPLAAFKELQNTTYAGQMLSSGFGGGTANIEFEALTSFSMELFNPQMTTPYTMLVPKVETFPSVVDLLKTAGYDATAIHPYNTSMYKRQDVYETLGFDNFLSEKTMTHTDTVENNPYISDASAYAEILDTLKETDTPQFMHLVTMQTHMPYANKYPQLDYLTTPQNATMENYYQDVHVAADALEDFLQELTDLPQRTLVVFWGDHLPSIYSEEIQAENTAAQLHLTEFLFYDTQGQLTEKNQHDAIVSPIYFAPDLFQQAGLKESPFYAFLHQLQADMPAFEKNMYYNGHDFTETFDFSQQAEELYHDYQLIQYDATSGEQYLSEEDFFTVS